MKQKTSKFFQQLYLTSSNYNRNGLWESAASCSFGFLLSFIPVLMIIVSVCAGILQVSPEVLEYVLELGGRFEAVYDIRPFVQNFMKIKGVSWVEIVLGVWLIWMARRFFLSIAQGMTRIFRSVTKPVPFIIQLMTFLAELILIFAVIIIVMASFLMNELFTNTHLTFLEEIFPWLFKMSYNFLTEGVFYFIIFVFTAAVYRYESRSKPKLRLCLLCAALCTLCFFAVSYFYNFFYDHSRVNLVYGAISAVIFLMMKVYSFFMLFLFFAQFIYVSQNYESLLFGELYFLPKIQDSGIVSVVKRALFFQPSTIQTEENTFNYMSGQTIFQENDPADSVYFIMKGKVEEKHNDQVLLREKGSFIGERSCIITKYRVYTAVALTDVELIKFSQEQYVAFLSENPQATSKFVRKITNY